MPKIKLRYQRVSDAKKFYEILRNPKFTYFPQPKNLKEEIKFLKENREKRRKNFQYNYAIMYDNKLVGGCGIRINQHRKHIGEIGFFVDENYWGQSIASKAVKLLEKTALSKMKLKRLEIMTHIKNKASIRVALKCGYKREGLLKKWISLNKGYADVYIFAKTK